MEFRFINNNAPLDRRSQKQVRNHAMKGKNLGRILPARGHKKQQQQGETRPDCWTTEFKFSTEDDERRPLLPKTMQPGPRSDIALSLNPFSGTEFAYFTGPVPLTSSVRYLFYEFYYSVSKELYPPVFCFQPEQEQSWDEISSIVHGIRVLADELALETWEDTATLLSLYPWVEAFHSKQSKKLWDIICRQ